MIFGNRSLATFVGAVLFFGFIWTSRNAKAEELTALGGSRVLPAPTSYAAISSTSYGSGSAQSAGSSYSGTVGLGLIGAELGFIIPSVAGLRTTWSLTVFPIVGAAGGAVGGYFLLDKGARHPTAAFDVLMVGVMALVIPGVMLTTWGISNKPKEEPIDTRWKLAIKRQASTTDHSDATELASAGLALPGIGKDDPEKNDLPPPDPNSDKDSTPKDVDARLEVAGSLNADSKNNDAPIETSTDSQVEISQQIKFNRVRANLTPKNLQRLEAVLKTLREHPEIKYLKIEGHADSTGRVDVNMALSERRAYRVLKWLRNHGIRRVRLSIRGLGSQRPIAPNDTDEGRRSNRRVEFHIEPD